ncbi:MAG: cyclic nucleotide-binding domain-containing protein [Kofleriaceae bacterium]
MSDKPPSDDPATKVAADAEEAERLAARAARLAAAKAAKAKKKAAEGGDDKAAKTDAPKTDAAKTDAAKADAPKTDLKTDAAKTDAAKADAAKVTIAAAGSARTSGLANPDAAKTAPSSDSKRATNDAKSGSDTTGATADAKGGAKAAVDATGATDEAMPLAARSVGGPALPKPPVLPAGTAQPGNAKAAAKADTKTGAKPDAKSADAKTGGAKPDAKSDAKAKPDTKAGDKKKLPVVDGDKKKPESKAAKTKAGGWAAFTDGGTAPKLVIAARVIMVVAFAATIPTILGFQHGNRLTWTIAVASLPFFWMAFGYHLWRRICPLAVMGQIGRLVGRPGTRKMGDWMSRNYFLFQLGFMVVALTLRLVATNGSHLWLAAFLGVVTIWAIATSFIYAGKTWCNFLCPVGMVEKFYTEPAPGAAAKDDLTSQCAPCVACKKHCPDIDLEQGYWKEASEKPRRVAYFSWPGIVVAFYTYYFLVSGTWSYYFSGAWTYERDLPSKMLDPGFTFLPAIPRVVAAPLTLIVFGLGSYLVFTLVEKVIIRSRLAALPTDAPAEAKVALLARIRHGMLAFCGFAGFNAFYLFAGQPSLQRLPGWTVSAWGLLVVFASTAIFVRRVTRREDQHVQEKFAQKILKKWEWGDAPPSDDLKDIYLLHTERTKQKDARLRAYKETVREMVADGLVTRNELVLLDSLRAQLGISDKDHQKIVSELSAEERQLFDPAYQGSAERRLAGEQYRKELERLVVEAARLGTSATPSSLEALRTERGVGEDEEHEALAQLLAAGGPIDKMYAAELAEIERLVAAVEAANQPNVEKSDSASLSLLRHLARRRAHEHAINALGYMAVMSKRPEVEQARMQAAKAGVVKLEALEAIESVGDSLRDPLTRMISRLARRETAAWEAAPLLAIAEDASRYVRAVIAMLLSRFEEEEPRKRIVAMLDDPDAIVREATVRAMGAKSRLTRDLLTKVLGDPDANVRHAAVRAVSGGTTSGEMPAMDPAALSASAFAQTKQGKGNAGVYATLDANAAMAQLTVIEKMMLIRQVPIFSELDAEDLEELAQIVEERRVEVGRDVFKEGDPGDAVYLVVKGDVTVFTGGGDTGRAEKVLNSLGAGACIGEMAVLDSAPRSATVRATSRARLLRVPGEGFKRVMSERPEMSQAIVAELVRRMRGMMVSASQQSGGPGTTSPMMSSSAIQLPKDDR